MLKTIFALSLVLISPVSFAATQTANATQKASQEATQEQKDRFVDAAWKGDMATIKQMLDEGFSPDLRGSTGQTALERTVLLGHLEITKLLLDRGANMPGWCLVF